MKIATPYKSCYTKMSTYPSEYPGQNKKYHRCGKEELPVQSCVSMHCRCQRETHIVEQAILNKHGGEGTPEYDEAAEMEHD